MEEFYNPIDVREIMEEISRIHLKSTGNELTDVQYEGIKCWIEDAELKTTILDMVYAGLLNITYNEKMDEVMFYKCDEFDEMVDKMYEDYINNDGFSNSSIIDNMLKGKE